MLGEDHIEAGHSLPSEVFADHGEADYLRVGKDAAQRQGSLASSPLGRVQIEQNQVTPRLLCFLDGGDSIADSGANPVGGAELNEEPDGVAHGGALVNDQDSRRVLGGHGSGNYYGFLPKTIRLYVFFRSVFLIEQGRDGPKSFSRTAYAGAAARPRH